MADPSMSPSGPADRHRLDASARERARALIQDELARASREALARNVSPDALADALDERIAWLRAQISHASKGGPAANV